MMSALEKASTFNLEGEVNAELTPERAGNERGGGGDEAHRMAESAAGDVFSKIVSVIGPIREIECLCN